MDRDRAARRADVNAFLASLGVDPGELAGLELPVTVDVMRARDSVAQTQPWRPRRPWGMAVVVVGAPAVEALSVFFLN